jgi:uncharacterized beta-barrel protein YwiB (DUF1934 family)
MLGEALYAGYIAYNQGQHTEGGQEDAIELITDGVLTHENGLYIKEYDESELSGIENTKTRLKVEDECIHLERQGALQTEFVFAKTKPFEASYSTPFGAMQVSVFPTHVQSMLSDKEGNIDLEYIIKIGGAEALNKLYIQYKIKN